MSNEVIYLSNVRLSFPNLIEPQKNKNEQGIVTRISYNAEFLMPADHQGYQNFMKRCGDIAQEKWKAVAQQAMTQIQADRKKRCFGQGTEKVNQKTFKIYDGYEGMMYITAGKSEYIEPGDDINIKKERIKPQIIQADGSAIDPANTVAYGQQTRKLYGGCRVNVAVKPWLQDNKHGKAVRCELVAVQFAADDTAFGAGEIDASDMFGATQTENNPTPPAAGMPSFLG